MTKLLEQAFEAARALTAEEQDALAQTMFGFIHEESEPYILSEEERVAVEEGMAEADRGEFASDEEVEALFARLRK